MSSSELVRCVLTFADFPGSTEIEMGNNLLRSSTFFNERSKVEDR